MTVKHVAVRPCHIVNKSELVDFLIKHKVDIKKYNNMLPCHQLQTFVDNHKKHDIPLGQYDQVGFHFVGKLKGGNMALLQFVAKLEFTDL